MKSTWFKEVGLGEGSAWQSKVGDGEVPED